MKYFLHRQGVDLCLLLLLTAFSLHTRTLWAQDPETEVIVHFDNLVAEPEPFTRFNIWAGSSIDQGNEYPKFTAQRFRIGDVSNVSSVTFMFSRIGTPGGRMRVSIHGIDAATDAPGDRLGVLGEFEVNSAPVFGDWCDQHEHGTVTVEGLVDGLLPRNEYFVVLGESSDELPQNLDRAGACGGPVQAWIIGLGPMESRGQIGSGGPHLTDWPWPSGGFPPGQWIPYEDHLSTYSLRLRIEGAVSESRPLEIDIADAVAVTWDSEVEKSYRIYRSTDMENWEVAIDVIRGTGERMMQAFVREETNVFYRVEVNP